MEINGWFGHPSTWLLLALVWLALGVLSAITFGLLARVGAWKERRGGK